MSEENFKPDRGVEPCAGHRTAPVSSAYPEAPVSKPGYANITILPSTPDLINLDRCSYALSVLFFYLGGANGIITSQKWQTDFTNTQQSAGSTPDFCSTGVR